jgi:hypothetical protein
VLPIQEQTVNKGPSTNNNIMNQIKESITTTTRNEPRRNKNRNIKIRFSNKTMNNIKNNNTTVPTTRLRGGGEANDLYYETRDNEEEEEEEKEKEKEEKSCKELASKQIIGKEKDITITKAGNEERPDNEIIEDRTKATKKKMKVTMGNLPFGRICDSIAIDNDTPYVRVYCQNVCGISDRDGIRLDSAFKEIKHACADIFTFNETHGDESNALARRVTRMSKQRMWKDNNEDCKIVHSSSTAPVLTFTKPGGNMVGITGSLVGRIRNTITYLYGRWCGYTLIGRDNKEIMMLTAYNVYHKIRMQK